MWAPTHLASSFVGPTQRAGTPGHRSPPLTCQGPCSVGHTCEQVREKTRTSEGAYCGTHCPPARAAPLATPGLSSILTKQKASTGRGQVLDINRNPTGRNGREGGEGPHDPAQPERAGSARERVPSPRRTHGAHTQLFPTHNGSRTGKTRGGESTCAARTQTTHCWPIRRPCTTSP